MFKGLKHLFGESFFSLKLRNDRIYAFLCSRLLTTAAVGRNVNKHLLQNDKFLEKYLSLLSLTLSLILITSHATPQCLGHSGSLKTLVYRFHVCDFWPRLDVLMRTDYLAMSPKVLNAPNRVLFLKVRNVTNDPDASNALISCSHDNLVSSSKVVNAPNGLSALLSRLYEIKLKSLRDVTYDTSNRIVNVTYNQSPSYVSLLTTSSFLKASGNTSHQAPLFFTSIKVAYPQNITGVMKSLLLRAGDVESNPGPRGSRRDRDGQGGDQHNEAHHGEGNVGSRKKTELQVITYNVRGFSDSKKLRHLINTLYKRSNDANNSIFLLQEVYSTKLELVRYLWRGEYHLTPGLGNSLGCLTLITCPYKIISATDIGNRAHVLVLAKDDPNKAELIVINAYAPNGFGQEKISFFDELLESINDLKNVYNCENILLGGDLNLVLCEEETRNRAFSQQEKRVAEIVNNLLHSLNLTDGWEVAKRRMFTWELLGLAFRRIQLLTGLHLMQTS